MIVSRGSNAPLQPATAASHAPLENAAWSDRRLVSTRDIQAFQAAVSNQVEPRHFSRVGPRVERTFELAALKLGRSNMYRVEQSGMRASCEQLRSYQLIIPLNGAVRDLKNRQGEMITRGFGLLTAPYESLDIQWETAASALVLHVMKDHFDKRFPYANFPHLHDAGAPARVINLEHGLGMALFNLLAQICREAIMANSADEMLQITELETAMLHVYSLLIEKTETAVDADFPGTDMPRCLRRSVEFIRANIEREISVEELVNIACASPRTLQYAFNKHFGKGPISFIRDLRLQKVRDILLQASPNQVSVSEVANTWGFHHASNFSRNYKGLFGELPSQTLARR